MGDSMWETLFHRMAKRLLVTGTLKITYPDGTTKTYGDGTAPRAAMAVRDKAALKAIYVNPEMGFGEGYMEGTVTTDDLLGLMQLIQRNYKTETMPGFAKFVYKARYYVRDFAMRNNADTSKNNVAHHYDISDDLYRLFLDEDMQYSCAYFASPEMSLEEAQAAKKAHIGRKLCIEPGMRVLDIGCGWGGLSMTLARDFGAQVTGVTLSENQFATAQQRVKEAGLTDRIELRLQDYRTITDPFDRIVSVGMLEHVGSPHFADYFSKVGELLSPDGLALIHTIGRSSPPVPQSPWLNKYIFPGGYVPSLSELAVPIENAWMYLNDIEILRLHYAMTLRHWLARFEDNLDTVRAMHDDRFIRMWRFYLIACIMTFEEQELGVFQIQLSHKNNVVPITRDYLYDSPRAHQQAAE
ncbi:SAM-dependent methyltransferase [Chachezhania antarctica]|uniref:SAM-dependent methyltransferase n=1 Tax=Chachezhania antarctica TaxID=2340860 RepID=UPI001F09F0C4|nr:cyclopropane-fatty-acyl-phospholipid synthase family protein [Chachezhania antarctica]